jgi:hypothetical protein
VNAQRQEQSASRNAEISKHAEEASSRLTIIPAQAGIQFKHASAGHNIYLWRAFARRMKKTGWSASLPVRGRPSPE